MHSPPVRAQTTQQCCSPTAPADFILCFNTCCTYCSQNGIVWGSLNAKNMQLTSLQIITAFTKVIFAFVCLKITYLLAIFVPGHSYLTWEVHDLLTLNRSLCYITYEFPVVLSYLPELREFCHLIHRPLKGSRPHMQYTLLFHELFKHQCSSIIHLWLALFLPLY